MSNLERERKCVQCEKAFTLSQHGVTGAQAVADRLDAGELDESDLPSIAKRCPACHGTGMMDEKSATVAMFRLDHATKQAKGRQIPKGVKQAVTAAAVFGTVGILFAQYLAGTRGPSPITTVLTAISATIVVAALAMGVVAVVGNFGRGPTDTENKLESHE